MIRKLRRWLLGRIETDVREITKDRRNVTQREALRAARQEAADKALEREWRNRVELNVARRNALRPLPYPHTRQAG